MQESIEDLKIQAEADLSDKKFDEALEKYQKIFSIDPQDISAHFKLIHIFAIRGQLHSVVNQYLVLADILESRGDFQTAVETCNSIIKLDPENIKARMKSILLYQKMNNPKEAINKSLTLARLLIELGHGDQSIKILVKAQEDDPGNLEIGLGLAEVYMSYGQIPEAVAQYRKVAETYLAKGMLSKAADVFRRLKLVASGDVEVLLTLGKIYLDIDKLNEAETEFRTVLRHDLNNINALKLLSLVCYRKGQFKDSILACNKILSIEPNEVTAHERLAESYIQQGELAEAVKRLLSAARIYHESSHTERSIKLYQKVLIVDATNPTACRELTNMGAPLTSEEAEAEVILPDRKEAVPAQVVEIIEPIIKETAIAQTIPIELKMPEEIEKRQKELIKLAKERKITPSGLIKASRDETLPAGLIKARKELCRVKASGLFKEAFPKGKIVTEPLIKRKAISKESLIPEEGLLKPKYSKQKEVIFKPKLVKREKESAEELLFEEKVKETAEIYPPEEKKVKEAFEEEIEEIEEAVKKEEAVPVKEIAFDSSEAEELIASCKLPEAIKYFKDYLDETPLDQKVRSALAKLYFDKGMLSQAVIEYKNLLKQEPKNQEYYPNLVLALGWLDSSEELINTYWRQIDIFKEAQDFENLMQAYQKILLIDGENQAAHAELAELYMNLDLKTEAVFHYEILAEKVSGQNQIKDAISIYEKIYELTGDLNVKGRMANIYESAGLAGDAKQQYLELSSLYKQKGANDVAIDCLHKVIELEWANYFARESLIILYKESAQMPYAIEEMFILGEVYLSLGQTEKSKNILEEVLKLKEDHLPARQKLIDVYFQLGLNNEAINTAEYVIVQLKKEKEYSQLIQLYQKLIEEFPKEVVFRKGLSDIYILNKEKDQALGELKKIILTLEEQGNWQEVVASYKKAIGLEDSSSELHYQLGIVYLEKLNDLNSANAEFERAYICDPSNLKAGHLLVGGYLKQNRPRQAMNMLNQLIQLDSGFLQLRGEIEEKYKKIVLENPEDFQSKFSLGIVYLEEGKIEEAIEQFQQTRKILDLQAASYNMLGVCFSKRSGVGMVDLAIRQFKKGLESAGASKEEYQELKENLANVYYSQGMHQKAEELRGG